MGLEAQVESALKSALVTAVAAIKGAVVRAWLVRDVEEAAVESVTYPCVEVRASPYVPEGYQSLHKAVPLTVRCMTQYDADKHNAALLALYDAVRGVIDGDTYTISGVSKQSTMVVDGESGRDEGIAYMEMRLSVLVCS